MANFSLDAVAAAQTVGSQINMDIESKRQDIAYKKQAMEQNAFAMDMQKQEWAQKQQQQQAMMKLIESEDQKTQDGLVKSGENPDVEKQNTITKEVESYRQKAKIYLMGGDAKNAEAYSKMADAAEARQTSTEKRNLEISEKKTKDLAGYAGAVLAGDVTPQEAFDTVKEKMGLKAAMSMPTDKEGFTKWWDKAQKQGLTANEQLTQALAAKKSEEDRKERAREANQNAELKRMMIAATAANRENRAPHVEEIGGKKYEYDPEGKLKGTRLGTDDRYVELGTGKSGAQSQKTQQQTMVGLNAALETERSLKQITHMTAGLTAGTFENAGDTKSVLGSLAHAGGNELTKEEQQMYQTATKGMGVSMAEASMLGVGKPTGAVIHEFQEMIKSRPGDTKFETMYRVANAADYMATRLKTIPKSPDPETEALRTKAMAAMEKYPSPTQIQDAAREAGVKLGKKGVEKQKERLSDALKKAEATTASPHPARIQELLDEFK